MSKLNAIIQNIDSNQQTTPEGGAGSQEGVDLNPESILRIKKDGRWNNINANSMNLDLGHLEDENR